MPSPRLASHRARGLLAFCLAAGLVACAGGAPQSVQAGAGSPTTSAIPADPPRSPVAGLSPAELKAVVEAPSTARSATVGVVTTDRVVVPAAAGGLTRSAGQVVLRIRIAGRQPVRAIPPTVTIGGRNHPAFVTPDLRALVVVVTDPSSVADGAPVSYRYGQEPPTAVGPLRIAP